MNSIVASSYGSQVAKGFWFSSVVFANTLEEKVVFLSKLGGACCCELLGSTCPAPWDPILNNVTHQRATSTTPQEKFGTNRSKIVLEMTSSPEDIAEERWCNFFSLSLLGVAPRENIWVTSL